MGLSGRKVKQRIGADPRNLTWADDASKFGATYLAKFGWSSEQGLGVAGEGRTSHVKVRQKLDMLGIGAAQSKDPNGIAWKQNKDFENLLKRLNADKESDQATAAASTPTQNEENIDEKESKKEKKKRKREEENGEKKKKRKTADKETVTEEPAADAPIAPKEAPRTVVSRPRAHRARHIAAKSFATKSAAAISEILGIASTSATPVVSTPTGTLTPLEPEPTMEKLTTSTKSVSDYFKERLLAKSSGKSTPIPNEVEVKTTLQVTQREYDSDDDDTAPRGGLGSSRLQSSAFATTSQITTSKFASMFASFTPATTSTPEEPSKDIEEPEVESEDLVAEKKKRKEEKKKEKRNKEFDDNGDELKAKEEKRKRKEERRKEKLKVAETVDEDMDPEDKKRKKKKSKKKDSE